MNWLLCLAQQEEPVNAGLYVKATTAAGVKPVAFLDQKKVLDYLHGRAEVGAPTIETPGGGAEGRAGVQGGRADGGGAGRGGGERGRARGGGGGRARRGEGGALELLKQPIEAKAPAAAAAGAEAAAAEAAADVEMEEAGGEAGGEAGAEDAAAAAPAEASDAARRGVSESGDGGGSGGKKKKKEAQVKGARIMGAAKAFIRHEAHKTKAIVKREQRWRARATRRRASGAQFDCAPLTPSARLARHRMRSRKSVLLAPHALVPARPRGQTSERRTKQPRTRANGSPLVGATPRGAAAPPVDLVARLCAVVVVVKGDAPRLVVVLAQRAACSAVLGVPAALRRW